MLAAEMAEDGELEGGAAPTVEEGVESEESNLQEKIIQEKEELERENDMIKKFGFTFDEEGQIILPEVSALMEQIKLLDKSDVFISLIILC